MTRDQAKQPILPTYSDKRRHTAAIYRAAAAGKPCEWLEEQGDNDFLWVRVDPLEEEHLSNVLEFPHCYRVKPEPVTRPWSKPEDVPGPVCWVRSAKNGSGDSFIARVTADGVWALAELWSGEVKGSKWTWRDLTHYGCSYSTDRKTWHPCTVTEDAQ